MCNWSISLVTGPLYISTPVHLYHSALEIRNMHLQSKPENRTYSTKWHKWRHHKVRLSCCIVEGGGGISELQLNICILNKCCVQGLSGRGCTGIGFLQYHFMYLRLVSPLISKLYQFVRCSWFTKVVEGVHLAKVKAYLHLQVAECTDKFASYNMLLWYNEWHSSGIQSGCRSGQCKYVAAHHNMVGCTSKEGSCAFYLPAHQGSSISSKWFSIKER